MVDNCMIDIIPLFYLNHTGIVMKANESARKSFFIKDYIGYHYSECLRKNELIELIDVHIAQQRNRTQKLLFADCCYSKYEWYDAEIVTMDNGDEEIRYVVAARDQTENIHSQSFLEATIQLSKDLILFFDKRDKLTYCSALTAAYLGYQTHEQAEGMRFMSLMEKGFAREDLMEIRDAVRNDREYTKKMELQFHQEEPMVFQVEAFQIVISGIQYGYFIFGSRTGSAKELNNIMNSQYILSEMLDSISHEIRTPMNAIVGSMEILSMNQNIPKYDLMHLQNIKVASEIITDIVNDISCYQNLEKKNISDEWGEYDFYEEMNQLIAVIYNRLLSRNMDLEISIDVNIPKTVIGVKMYNRFIIRQMFSYVIDNQKEQKVKFFVKREEEEGVPYICYIIQGDAIEYGALNAWYSYLLCRNLAVQLGASLQHEKNKDNKSYIKFRMRLQSHSNFDAITFQELNGVKLLVLTEDANLFCHVEKLAKNIGIVCCNKDEEDWESCTHILIDEHTFKAAENSGHSIEKLHKILYMRNLEVKAGHGKYVDEIMYAPIYEYKLAQCLLHHSTVKERQLMKKSNIFQTRDVRVLIVDDSEVNRMITTHMLKQFMIECDETDNGYRAIDLIRENHYDIVFLDYLMPEMDGKQTLRYIRTKVPEGKDIPVVILSANMVSETKAMLLGIYANDVLSKPLELQALSDVLIKWLPKNKLIFENLDELQPVKEKDNILNLLMEVDELNVNAGMNTVLNHVDQYVIVLRMSAKNIQEELTQMRNLFEHQEYSKMSLHYHSLKGIFLNIGANELMQMSAEGERQANAGEIDAILYSYESYIYRIKRFYRDLIAKLEMIKACEDNDKEQQKLMDEERYKELLEQLGERIKRFEYNEIHKIMKEIINMVIREKKDVFRKLQEYVEEFDYDGAGELLERIKRGEA